MKPCMFRHCRVIPAVFALAVFASCGDEEAEVRSLAFSPSKAVVAVGRTCRAALKVDAGGETGGYDFAADPLELSLASGDERIAVTEPGGLIRGVGVGRTVVTASTPDGRFEARLSVVVSPDFDKTLGREMIYADGMKLWQDMAMQSFDVDAGGALYVAGALGPAVVVQRCPRGGTASEPMTIHYAGHATNMSVEEQAGQTYVWVANFATRYPDGAYFGEQVVSRIAFEPGKTLLPEECADNYYVGPYKNLCVSVDTRHDLLCILFADAAVPGTNTRVCIYSLAAAESLPVSEVALLELTRGGEAGGPRGDETLRPRIPVHDLRKIEPLHEFRVNSTLLNGDLPMQGFSVGADRIYWCAGAGGRNDSGLTPPRATVSEVDFSGGIIRLHTPVRLIADTDLLQRYGLTDSGYFEAEGIRVAGGTYYLGYISNARQDQGKWRAHVLRGR